MRYALLNSKVVGKELAMPIYLSNGQVYAKEGMALTEKNIEILKDAGIETVYIKDENDSMELTEIFKSRVMLEVINDLRDVFDRIKKGNNVDENKIISIVDKIINNLDISENSFLINNIGQKLRESKLVIHSINITILSLLIGINMKYDKEKLQKLAIGAILHDVGKIFNEGKDHCKVGYEFIKNRTHLPVTSYMCILHHHECEDGTGYPEKITGEKIHEFSKIVSICNEYINALESKKFKLPSTAIEYIGSMAGMKFNKEIHKEFLNCTYLYPNGLQVKLSNGKVGVIVLQNKNFPSRPMIGIIENGCPIICNLMEQLTLFIEEIII